MRVDVSPAQAEIIPGQPIIVSVSIANTSTVIGGYVVRVLGADPSWVEMNVDRISLFPDEARTVDLTITAPRGLPAGVRRIAVQVRELTPPHDTSISEIDLHVPQAGATAVRLDPYVVTAGRRASYSVLLENTGNTMLHARPAGEDPEGKVTFRFVPDAVNIGPGEHAVIDLELKARRHFLGSPTVRVFNLYLDDLATEEFFEHPPPADPEAKPDRSDEPVVATGTFVQRAVLARGSVSVLGLLAAVTVFALVITIALSRLVGQSAADRNLALQIAAARDSSGTAGTSALGGTVRSLTTGKGVQGVAVIIYAGSDTSSPVATTATSSTGGYQVTNLAAGQYTIEFQGAGLLTTWYPAATTSTDAQKVSVKAGALQSGLDVKLGGVPASISGTITGDDVSASTLFLETAPSSGSSSNTAHNTVLSPGTVSPPNDGLAVVQSVPIGADGQFALTNVQSPATYTLVVVKPGYAQSRVQIDVGAGESRSGVTISLNKGDGLIAGTVTAAGKPLGGVTITATSGQTAVNTVSVTGQQAGTFTLRQLPTPATYTIVASAAGFASQTLTVSVASGQQLKGLAITMNSSSGELAGSVDVSAPGQPNTPATGVAVTVTDGQLTVQTETDSTTNPGTWHMGGLPIPGTYTVTFSRIDLATQIVSVSLDAAGNVTPGSRGATINNDGTIAITMKSATAVVSGTVEQPGGGRVCGPDNQLGEATVTLASGTSTYTVTTATLPSKLCGQYRIENIPPGTYTLTASAGPGTVPEGETINLTAGEAFTQGNFNLKSPASLSGTVIDTGGQGLCSWTVDLYLQEDYPNTAAATTTTSPPGKGGTCDGSFAFDNISAGTYIVSVGPSPGNPITTKTVVVKASKPATVTVQVSE